MMMNKLNKSYWENRYQENKTGWNIGYPSTPLKNFIDNLDDKTIRILVPGAGNGYEVEYLWNKGHTNVNILDFVKQPLDNFKKRNPDFPESQIINANFFTLEKQYDLILEQTFFCALEPNLREDYVKKMHQTLKPNGMLAGLLFNFPLTSDGPPFGGSIEEYKNLFSPYFKLKTLETSVNSIKERQGKELFFIFEKKS